MIGGSAARPEGEAGEDFEAGLAEAVDATLAAADAGPDGTRLVGTGREGVLVGADPLGVDRETARADCRDRCVVDPRHVAVAVHDPLDREVDVE